MTAYLVVYGRDPTDRLAAYVFPDRASAWHAGRPASLLVPRVPPDGPAGGCAYVVEAAADAAFSTMLLLAIYNGLSPSGARVHRFESYAVAQRRLVALLATVARPPTEDEGEYEMPNDATPPTSAARGLKLPIPVDARIRLLVERNPKRPSGSGYARFQLYRDGMTVAEYLAAGGTRADLSWDRTHRFIAIE